MELEQIAIEQMELEQMSSYYQPGHNTPGHTGTQAKLSDKLISTRIPTTWL